MDEFYVLKDEEYTLRNSIPRYLNGKRSPEDCKEYIHKAIALWQKVQSNGNLTTPMKDTLFHSLYHGIASCHDSLCSICNTTFHVDKKEYITHLLNTTPELLLESCASK